jgi:hypothetical protein
VNKRCRNRTQLQLYACCWHSLAPVPRYFASASWPLRLTAAQPWCDITQRRLHVAVTYQRRQPTVSWVKYCTSEPEYGTVVVVCFRRVLSFARRWQASMALLYGLQASLPSLPCLPCLPFVMAGNVYRIQLPPVSPKPHSSVYSSQI